MTQYQRDVVRMWDSIRTLKRGSADCIGVSCRDCPLYNRSCVSRGSIYRAEKSIEIVTQWAKEHPIVTNEQKYEEVFGVKPVNIEAETESYVCPKFIGFGVGISCNAQSSCGECKEKFWRSEYKPPKKER